MTTTYLVMSKLPHGGYLSGDIELARSNTNPETCITALLRTSELSYYLIVNIISFLL